MESVYYVNADITTGGYILHAEPLLWVDAMGNSLGGKSDPLIE